MQQGLVLTGTTVLYRQNFRYSDPKIIPYTAYFPYAICYFSVSESLHTRKELHGPI